MTDNSTQPPIRHRARNIFMVLVVIILAYCCTELIYRARLHDQLLAAEWKKPEPDPTPDFRFFQYPHTVWRFDADEGWDYHDTWISGGVKDGAFDRFTVEHPLNEHGTVGKLETRYEDADVKILVFGSSYTPAAITNLFQERLSKILGETVCALTFTKGSTGLLAFLDMARVRAEKYQPDMILFAISTTCLRINRRGWVNHPVSEHFWRFYLSVEYTEDVHPKTHVLHNQTVITDLVTPEWGEAMLAAKEAGDEKQLREDPVILAMIDEYHDIQMEHTKPFISNRFRYGARPFLLTRLLGKDPMDGLDVIEKKFTGGDLAVKTNVYPTDPDFLEAVEYLKTNQFPFYIVHIPNLPEVEAGTGILYKSIGFGPKPWDETIGNSIEEVIDDNIIYLAEYYEPEVRVEPLKLFGGVRDWHPSEEGESAQADALVNLYLNRLQNQGN
jgi:hypothetical protein